MTYYGRGSSVTTLAAYVGRIRPALKAAALAGDGPAYGLLWRAIEVEARRLGVGSHLEQFRDALSPDALRLERK